jgi:hypothetical protein
MPGNHGRGRLGVVLEESIEKVLELRGACTPGIAACSDSDASLSDQLYRARLLGAPGLALSIERLEAIANHAGALDAEDSAVLRWWVMTARERPLRLYFDSHDETLGIYTAPTHFGSFVRSAECDDSRPSTPPPIDVQMESSLRSMQALVHYDPINLQDLAAPPSGSREVSDDLPQSDPEPSEPPISAVFGAVPDIFEQSAASDDSPSKFAAELLSGHSESPIESISEAEATLAELSQALANVAGFVESMDPPQNDAEGPEGSDTAAEASDCSEFLTACAAEPITPPSPKAKPVPSDRTLPSIAIPHPEQIERPVQTERREVVAVPPLFPDADGRWREWMRVLDQARGPRPLGAVEQLYVNAYVPLYDAATRGIADPEAFEVLDTWSSSFAKSYREAFDALRLRGKRPMMVLDVADAAHRLGRLHGARSVQLVLVDGLRFDLGLRLEARMRQHLGQQAAMTERLLLWSALPSTTATQLELLGRGPEGLKNYDPPTETGAFVSHGRAAATLRRVRTGSRDVMKLDMVSARLAEPGVGSPEGLDALADDVALALSSALLKFSPRTMAVVFGDHGFIADRSQNWANPTRHGGSSPEEVLVPAFAWLVGATH